MPTCREDPWIKSNRQTHPSFQRPLPELPRARQAKIWAAAEGLALEFVAIALGSSIRRRPAATRAEVPFSDTLCPVVIYVIA
jgi:hypothetical protein